MVDPLYQFTIQTLFTLSLFGLDISFTNSSLFMVLSTLLIILLMFYGAHPKRMVPGRIQVVLEGLYGFVYDMVKSTIGPKGLPFFPYILSLFMFIAMGNLVGMTPYSFTFTSHIIVTVTLACLVMLMVTAVGFYQHGLGFLKLFFPEGTPLMLAPLMVPIEIVSYLARVVSLSVRLFANMVAGHAMLKVFAGFVVVLAGSWLFMPLAVLPLAVNVGLTAFKILVALLQSYIFTILTCIYLNDAINMH